MRTRLCIFAVLIFFGAAPLQAQVGLTPSNPLPATPPTLTAASGDKVIADPATLVGSSTWNSVLSQVLDKQGFSEQNDWVYSFNNASPPFPAGVVQPTPLGNNANFSVLTYTLNSYVDNTYFGETLSFRLKYGTTVPPNPGNDYTVTAHWLQLINESSKFNNFGYAVPGQPGYWFLDNGRVPWSPGAGPFYDSNDSGFSTPPNYFDNPKYYQGAGTYLHFTTIPAWEISNGGTVDWLVVANTGLTWGFAIVPEPSSMVLLAQFVLAAAVAETWRRRRRAAARRPANSNSAEPIS